MAVLADKETQVTERLYEGMFLVDNEAVREDWKGVKSALTGLVEKHGARVETARRWDERRLAYPIAGRLRGTYFLLHFKSDTQAVAGMRRDLELSEIVLRYILKRVEALPEGEQELSDAELAADYVAPPPPTDEAPEPEPEPEGRRAERGGEKAPAAEAGPARPQTPVGEAAAEPASEPVQATKSEG